MASILRAKTEETVLNDVHSKLGQLNRDLGALNDSLKALEGVAAENDRPTAGEALSFFSRIASNFQERKTIEDQLTELRNQINLSNEELKSFEDLKDNLTKHLEVLIKIGIEFFPQSIQQHIATSYDGRLDVNLSAQEIADFFYISASQMRTTCIATLIEEGIINESDAEALDVGSLTPLLIAKVENETLTSEKASNYWEIFNFLENGWRDFVSSLTQLFETGSFQSITPRDFITDRSLIEGETKRNIIEEDSSSSQSTAKPESFSDGYDTVLSPNVFAFFLKRPDAYNKLIQIGQIRGQAKVQEFLTLMEDYNIKLKASVKRQSNFKAKISELIKNLEQFSPVVEAIRNNRFHLPEFQNYPTYKLFFSVARVMNLNWYVFDRETESTKEDPKREKKRVEHAEIKLQKLFSTIQDQEGLRQELKALSKGYSQPHDTPSLKSLESEAIQLSEFLREVEVMLNKALNNTSENIEEIVNYPFLRYVDIIRIFYRIKLRRKGTAQIIHPTSVILTVFFRQNSQPPRTKSFRYLQMPEFIKQKGYKFNYDEYIRCLVALFDETEEVEEDESQDAYYDQEEKPFTFFTENPECVESVQNNLSQIFSNQTISPEDLVVCTLFLDDAVHYIEHYGLDALWQMLRDNRYQNIAAFLENNKDKLTAEFVSQLYGLQEAETDLEDFEDDDDIESDDGYGDTDSEEEEPPYSLDARLTEQYVFSFFAQKVNGESVWEKITGLFNGGGIISYLRSKSINISFNSTSSNGGESNFDFQPIRDLLQTPRETLESYMQTEEFKNLPAPVKLLIHLATDKNESLINILPSGQENPQDSNIDIDIDGLPEKRHNNFDIDRRSIKWALNNFKNEHFELFRQYYKAIIGLLNTYLTTDSPNSYLRPNGDRTEFVLGANGREFRIVFVKLTNDRKSILVCGLIYKKHSSSFQMQEDENEYQTAKSNVTRYLQEQES